MAGEINGTKVLLSNSVGEIVGQGSITMTFGGTPIDISNKSNGDWVTYMDGELATKQFVFSGDFIYNNSAAFKKLRDDVFSGTMDTYTITIPNSGATVDESFEGTFMPTAPSDAFNHGDKVVTSLSLNSSGEVTRTPAS